MIKLNREQMAWRVARDIPNGSLVNLGLGIPVLVSNHLPDGCNVMLQSENGVGGVGPVASEDEADADLVDAGSRRITLAPGASIVDSVSSFAMIRGGHIDITVLGAFEVASNGDLANWNSKVPDKGPLVGGAMDLAVGSKQTWAVMSHTTRQGAPRLLERCELPLTGKQCVTRVYTDLAVVHVTEQGFEVHAMLEGISRDNLCDLTGAPLHFADGLETFRAPELPG